MLVMCIVTFLTFSNIHAQENVGIGVSNPQQKLDVNGGIRIGSTASDLEGSVRWNPTLKNYQGYISGLGWVNLYEGFEPAGDTTIINNTFIIAGSWVMTDTIVTYTSSSSGNRTVYVKDYSFLIIKQTYGGSDPIRINRILQEGTTSIINNKVLFVFNASQSDVYLIDNGSNTGKGYIECDEDNAEYHITKDEGFILIWNDTLNRWLCMSEWY